MSIPFDSAKSLKHAQSSAPVAGSGDIRGLGVVLYGCGVRTLQGVIGRNGDIERTHFPCEDATLFARSEIIMAMRRAAKLFEGAEDAELGC